MVLMADKKKKAIEKIDAGDAVYSPSGPVAILRLDKTKLGNRNLYAMFDWSLQWSAEHAFWVKRNKKQYLWSMDPAAHEDEARAGAIGGLRDYSKMFHGSLMRPELFAVLEGGSGPARSRSQGRPICRFTCRSHPNGELIFVNGYLVGAGVDEFKTDYSKLRWECSEFRCP